MSMLREWYLYHDGGYGEEDILTSEVRQWSTFGDSMLAVFAGS